MFDWILNTPLPYEDWNNVPVECIPKLMNEDVKLTISNCQILQQWRNVGDSHREAYSNTAPPEQLFLLSYITEHL